MNGIMMEFMAPHRLWALLIIPLIGVLYVVLSSRISKRRPMSSRLSVVVPRDAAWKQIGRESCRERV